MTSKKWEPSHMRLSPSKINTYMKCPREFYYKYIAKIPEKKTIHLFRGTLVHYLNGKKEDLLCGYKTNSKRVGKKK